MTFGPIHCIPFQSFWIRCLKSPLVSIGRKLRTVSDASTGRSENAAASAGRFSAANNLYSVDGAAVSRSMDLAFHALTFHRRRD